MRAKDVAMGVAVTWTGIARDCTTVGIEALSTASDASSLLLLCSLSRGSRTGMYVVKGDWDGRARGRTVLEGGTQRQQAAIRHVAVTVDHRHVNKQRPRQLRCIFIISTKWHVSRALPGMMLSWAKSSIRDLTREMRARLKNSSSICSRQIDKCTQ